MLMFKYCNAFDSVSSVKSVNSVNNVNNVNNVNSVNSMLAVYSAVLPPSLMDFLVLKIPCRLHVSPLCYLSN